MLHEGPMNDNRSALRNELQTARSALNEAAQRNAANAIVDRVRTSVAECRASIDFGTVASYLPHGGELDAMPAAEALRARGWRVLLPVCGPNASMEFCPWQPGDELTFNRYGIGEPVSNAVALKGIDVVLVPGVGFDVQGSRIGHGVGFYDRFFARCAAAGHEPLRLAIAHDLQVVDLPPPEPWDVPMHRVLTPTKVIDRT